ncbi:hypothetical protein AB0P28_14945 [Pseudarthrobacter sp. NPDC089323]
MKDHEPRQTASWYSVNRGDEVELLSGNRIIARGTIDAHTDDREIIWLEPSRGHQSLTLPSAYGGGRRMYHRTDGWTISLITAAP